jgi:hypothetical protein
MFLFTANIVEVFISKPESSETLLRDVHDRHLMDEFTLQNYITPVSCCLFRHDDAEFRKKKKLVLNSPGSVSTYI